MSSPHDYPIHPVKTERRFNRRAILMGFAVSGVILLSFIAYILLTFGH
jgi:hypothetical protein